MINPRAAGRNFFFGRAWSEPALLKIAFAYEQATKLRRPPKFLPTLQTTS